MEEDDEFYDTVSLTSHSQVPIQKRRSYNKDYVSLSRNTIYHSAMDLDAMEMNDILPKRKQLKVSKIPKTYSQWRDRVKLRFEENLQITKLSMKSKYVLSVDGLSLTSPLSITY